MDPNWQNLAFESGYSFTSDNPIFYVDKEGETKYRYLVINNEKDGTSITIQLPTSDGLVSEVEHVAIGSMFGQGGVSEPRHMWYDVEETLTLNYTEGGEVTMEFESKKIGSPKTSTAYNIEWWANLKVSVGEMEIGTGGYRFTSSGYAGNMETREGDFRAPSVNIDALMMLFDLAGANRGAGAGDLPHTAKLFEDVPFSLEALHQLGKTMNQQFGNVANVLDVVTLIVDEVKASSGHRVCSNCGKIINNATNRPVEPREGLVPNDTTSFESRRHE